MNSGILLVLFVICSTVSGQIPYPCDYLDATCDEEREYNNVTERLMSGRRCFCDEKCSLHGDCCDIPSSPRHGSQVKCARLRFHENLYVGVYVHHFCRDGVTPCVFNDEDPLSSLPAYSSLTQVTYQNLFCALCNQENFNDLEFGEIKFECRKGMALSNEVTGNPLKYFVSDGGSLQKVCRLNYKLPTGSGIIRCIPTIDSCPVKSNDNDVSACSSYMRTVFDGDNLYKNPNCAQCNGVVLDNLTATDCLTPLLKSTITTPDGLFTGKDAFAPSWTVGYSMTILLDLNLGNGNLVGADRKCAEGSVYDPWLDLCRNVLCLSSKDDQFLDGVCRSSRDAVGPNERPESNMTAMQITSLKNCPRIEFYSKEYELSDGMIYVNSSGKFYNLSDVFFNGSVAAVCLTYEYDEFVKSFSEPEVILSIICFVLSLFCLTLHFTVYILAGKFRLVPDLNMLSISAAIFLVHIFFLLAPVAQRFLLLDSVVCTLNGVLLHYFTLSSFTWSTVIAYDITKSVLSLEHPSFSSVTYTNYIRYSLFAWLSPAIPVITAIVLDHVLPDSDYSPMYGKNVCWIGRRKSLLVFFAAPVAAIIVGNLVFYVVTINALWRSHKARMDLKIFTQKEPQNNTRFGLYLKLAMIMGIAWITGFVAIAYPPLRYVSIIMNGLQGVYIFAAFSCKKSVLQAAKNRRRGIGSVFDRLTAIGSSKSSSSKSTTSICSAGSRNPVAKSVSGSSAESTTVSIKPLTKIIRGEKIG